jgi:hypothetical protein
MRFDCPLELFDDPPRPNVAWHPVLPARDLPSYRGRAVSVTREYLEAAAAETKRYYGDLAQQGLTYKRPILTAHADGERHGELLDFDVRDLNGEATLFVKSAWLDESWRRVHNGEFERGSIKIVPEHTDPQTGQTYGPFIDEFSVTAKPVIKDYRLTDFTTPEALAAVGLKLAEEPMGEPKQTPEGEQQNELSLQEPAPAEGAAPAEGGGGMMDGVKQLVTDLSAIVGPLVSALNEMAAMLGTEPPAPAEGEGEVEASEKDAPAPAEPKPDEGVVVQLAEMKDELERMKRAAKLRTQEQGSPGELTMGQMSAETALKRAKAEGLTGLAAVKRAKELRGDK